MKKIKNIGKIYEFCKDCAFCPTAIEAKVNGKSGLEIKDDFGGTAKLTDQNLKDLMSFLQKRFGE